MTGEVDVWMVAWALASTGVLLGALELMFGTRGSIACAILWPVVLGAVFLVIGLSAVVACVVVVCWVPVAIVAAVASALTRAKCASKVGGATERVGGVSE